MKLADCRIYDHSDNSNNFSRSGHDVAIAPFLNQDEKWLTNYASTHPSTFKLPSLEDYIRRLQESGEYLSVRTSTEACFDMKGIPYSDSVAIIVTPIPKKV